MCKAHLHGWHGPCYKRLCRSPPEADICVCTYFFPGGPAGQLHDPASLAAARQAVMGGQEAHTSSATTLPSTGTGPEAEAVGSAQAPAAAAAAAAERAGSVQTSAAEDDLYGLD